MNLRDFKIGWRQLVADPGYSAVVIFGLALACSTVVLLLAYLDTALRGDADVPEARRVVRVESKTHTPGADRNWIPDSPMAFYDHWSEVGEPVSATSRYFLREMSVRVDSRLFLQNISFVDPGIATLFGLRAISGDIEDALKRPDAAVLSEKTAARFFGSAGAIGKTVQVAGQTLTIRAIVHDRPSGSAISTEFLVNVTSPVMPDPFRLQFWMSIRGTNYARLLAGATPEQFTDRAQAYFEQTSAYRELAPVYGKIATFRAVPLPDLPLSGAGSETIRRLVVGLSFSCLIISLLAAINYLNLSTVRAIARQREIGIRKALGANPARIATQFLEESILVALIACAIGIVIGSLAAPVVGEWVNQRLATDLFSPTKIAVALILSVALGLLAGAYPAWVALRVDCARSLAGRGQMETHVGLWFRRGLTILQFAAAMALIGMTVVVLWQTHHARQADPGYEAAPLLAIDAPVDMRDSRLPAMRDAISHLPGVQAVGLAWDVPGRFRRNTTTDVVTPRGQTVLLASTLVGPDFFQSYGISPMAGRIFDRERDKQGNREIIVINARAARELGFTKIDEAVGQKLRMGDQTVEIIGVIPDIRQRSMRDESGGVIYSIRDLRGVSVLSVRSNDPALTRRDIQFLWPTQFPDDVLQIEPVQAQLERLYSDDLRLGKLIGIGGLIALGLAGCGVYALSAYTARRRTAEIVLRKLHGASRSDIARLMAREISMLLAIGALLGLPVAAWLGERFLSGYVDRAPVGIWALAIAFGCTLTMAVLAGARHTMRAIAISPAEALRV